MRIGPQKLRWIGNLALLGYLGCVIYSGFAYPLKYGSGLWPFNRDWFMFSYETGYDYELQVLGETSDGQMMVMDPTPFFQFPVASKGNRFQETLRDTQTMRRMAHYLCARLPAKTITIHDLTWPRPTGRRLSRQEVDPAKITSTTWVDHYACAP